MAVWTIMTQMYFSNTLKSNKCILFKKSTNKQDCKLKFSFSYNGSGTHKNLLKTIPKIFILSTVLPVKVSRDPLEVLKRNFD